MGIFDDARDYARRCSNLETYEMMGEIVSKEAFPEGGKVADETGIKNDIAFDLFDKAFSVAILIPRYGREPHVEELKSLDFNPKMTRACLNKMQMLCTKGWVEQPEGSYRKNFLSDDDVILFNAALPNIIRYHIPSAEGKKMASNLNDAEGLSITVPKEIMQIIKKEEAKGLDFVEE